MLASIAYASALPFLFFARYPVFTALSALTAFAIVGLLVLPWGQRRRLVVRLSLAVAGGWALLASGLYFLEETRMPFS